MGSRFVVFVMEMTVAWWQTNGGLVTSELDSCREDHVAIGPGAWVFRLPAAAPVVHALSQLSLGHGLDFLVLPVDTPPTGGLSSLVAQKLQAMGLEVDNIRRPDQP